MRSDDSALRRLSPRGWQLVPVGGVAWRDKGRVRSPWTIDALGREKDRVFAEPRVERVENVGDDAIPFAALRRSLRLGLEKITTLPGGRFVDELKRDDAGALVFASVRVRLTQ